MHHFHAVVLRPRQDYWHSKQRSLWLRWAVVNVSRYFLRDFNSNSHFEVHGSIVRYSDVEWWCQEMEQECVIAKKLKLMLMNGHGQARNVICLVMFCLVAGVCFFCDIEGWDYGCTGFHCFKSSLRHSSPNFGTEIRLELEVGTYLEIIWWTCFQSHRNSTDDAYGIGNRPVESHSGARETDIAGPYHNLIPYAPHRSIQREETWIRVSPHHPTRGLGECCKLPRWVRGRVPAENGFFAFWGQKEATWNTLFSIF